MEQVRNMIVTRAGYEYIGHFRRGQLRIVLEGSCSGCALCPKDEFEFIKLFSVFDIDSENGVLLESIQGKPCRVIFNEEGYPVKLQHIINDKIIWEAK